MSEIKGGNHEEREETGKYKKCENIKQREEEKRYAEIMKERK